MVSAWSHTWVQVILMEGVFGTLRDDVEALFLTAPNVSLEALEQELHNMQDFILEEVRTHLQLPVLTV
jgi:hypothetical protein